MHENLPFTLWHVAPFLQGELSHGLTKDKRKGGNVLVKLFSRIVLLQSSLNFSEYLFLIVPFSSHVSPSNPSAHSHENASFTLVQVAPFLQGELSHGLTIKIKREINILVILLQSCFWISENIFLIVPFSSQGSPSNPSTHSHENASFTLWQVAPFLQGELSHGLTKDKRNV